MSFDRLPGLPSLASEDEALRAILAGTSDLGGQSLFNALVQNVAATLHYRHAWLGRLLPGLTRVKVLACWADGALRTAPEYELAATPCEAVVRGVRLLHHADAVLATYPHAARLRAHQARAYLGMPLRDVDGCVIGHLAVSHDAPRSLDERVLGVFQIYADRAAAELRRLNLEGAMGELQGQLDAVMESVPNAMLLVDGDLRVRRVNRAAAEILGLSTSGSPVSSGPGGNPFATATARRQLCRLVAGLARLPQGIRPLRTRGELVLHAQDGQALRAEAVLTRYEAGERCLYIIRLRSERSAAPLLQSTFADDSRQGNG